MPIDSTNKKLALLEFEDVWEPGLPMAPGALGQDDQQQLLWGYPGILWGLAAHVPDYITLHDFTFSSPSVTGVTFNGDNA